MPRPLILDAAALPPATTAELHALFDVVALPEDPAVRAALLAAEGARIRGMALHGVRVDAGLLAALPALEVISSYSAGLDNLDIAAAKARGIRIENTSAVLADDVANHAIALALGVTRQLVQADSFLRAGKWQAREEFPLTRSMVGMTVGIVGLGSIGMAIARRLEAMGARVAYAGRSPKPVAYAYHSTAAALAEAVEMLILACPLTAETRHMIDAPVLNALGPRGYLVNIGRGPVVDEAALVAALQAGRIAGAALDVFEDEPQVPQALIQHPRVMLTPHIGSGTIETRQGMADHVVDALARHFGVAGPRG